jgi:predicted nucleic acid-binding protein
MVENNLFVADSSFVLSLLLPDEQTLPKANKSLKVLLNPKNKILCPSLLEYEVGNGIRSAYLSKRILEQSISKLIDNFHSLPLRIVKVDLRKTLEVSVKSGISVYDATYVYLAMTQKAKLLTLDRKLEKAGVQVKGL